MPTPIRISVRLDFDDGSEHTYEVRGPSAVDAPLVPHWVPAAVMSADAAERVEHDRKRQEEIAGLRSDLDQLLAVATGSRGGCGAARQTLLTPRCHH